MTRGQAAAACAAVMAVSLIRIAATHRVFSQTFDESIHVAAGYDWLTSTYDVDPDHPPLARILFGLPFRNVPAPQIPWWDWNRLGNDLLARQGRYIHNLAHARSGNLLFALFGFVGVVLWAAHRLDRATALVALIIYSSLPPVLAHAGLATTDMAGAAALAVASVAAMLLIEKPTWKHTILAGVIVGIGLLSKYSFLPFFAVTFVILCFARRRLPLVRTLIAIALGLLIVWSAYSFSFGTMNEVEANSVKAAVNVFGSPSAASIRLPAPMYWVGLLHVRQHDLWGHQAYLLGKLSRRGWWYYFPIALLVKTPIAMLVLTGAGAITACRHRAQRELIAIPGALLAFAMTSNINIGVRHVLPVYAPMAILAAWAAVRWWSAGGYARFAAVALTAWLVIGSGFAHPDYLPWMNALAGRDPSRVLVDSNFDWGQDLLRLARRCHELGITRLGTSVFTSANTADFAMPDRYEISRHEPSSGWIALSETQLRVGQAEDPEAFAWLVKGRSYRRIGKTVRLYELK